MKLIARLLLVNLLVFLISYSSLCKAQESDSRADKLYFRSGFGVSFPAFKTNNYLSFKFSTSLGFMMKLANGPFFLYPKLNLHAFGFDQQVLDKKYPGLVSNGRATTYLLNMALGYRKTVDKFGFYGFFGAGGGMILTPRAKVNPETLDVLYNNEPSAMPIIETGGGIDYSLGNTQLFFEASFMKGLNRMQNQVFESVPVNIGVKTNISRIFFK